MPPKSNWKSFVFCKKNVCVIVKSNKQRCVHATSTTEAVNSWAWINSIQSYRFTLAPRYCENYGKNILWFLVWFSCLKFKTILLWDCIVVQSKKTIKSIQTKWIAIIRIHSTTTMAKSRLIGFLHCQKVHRFDSGQHIYFHHRISSK